MPVLTVFYIKLLINLVLTIGIIWTISRSDLFSKWQRENDKLIFTLGFVLFRLIPWIGIFLIINEEPRGDIPFFFIRPKVPRPAVSSTAISGRTTHRFTPTLSAFRFGSGTMHVRSYFLWC
jgi:hypothetical protein